MYDGVINICKEAGFTSHDVVAKLRGILKQKKIGHTGTLDPDAVGVLPVCLGRATKLCDMLTDETKTYEAVLKLGVVTDTQDLSGEALEEHQVQVSEEELRECIAGFVGEQMQVPPMYSALKVDGKRLYELAREGKIVERKARPVNFFEIEPLEVKLPHVVLRVTCSKGTYIRTLCHDIGQKLGCGGAMEHLTRTRVGRFDLEHAWKLCQIEEFVKADCVGQHLVTVEEMFSDIPSYTVKPEFDILVHNGNPVADRDAAAKVRMYDSQDKFIGVYYFDGEKGLLRPLKMF